MRTKLFRGDLYYIDQLHSFPLFDTLIAACCYIGILFVYHIMGCVDMSLGVSG